MGTATTTAATSTGNKLLSTEDLEGTRVLGAKGEEIGTIDHLMVDRETGQVVYAVISFGGFLGLGHSHYPVPWRALRYDYEQEGYSTDINEATVRDAPAFSDDSYGDQDLERRVFKHYGVPPS